MTLIRLAGAVTASALAVCTLGCRVDGGLGSSGSAVYAVHVVPPGYALVVGDSTQFWAYATTQSCASCPESTVQRVSFEWASSDASIISFVRGFVRAVGAGTAHVTARALGLDGVTGSARVHVGTSYIPLAQAGPGGYCALSNTATVYCWGPLYFGPADSVAYYQARPVAGGLQFSSLAVGSTAACGITTGGQGYCWGRGELGGAHPDTSGNPVLVAGALSFRAISPGRRVALNPTSEHACGVAADGGAWCWGADDAGQLGTDAPLVTCYNSEIGHDYPCSPTPVRVAGGLGFTAVSAGGQHTCALTVGGTAYCWGDNRWGQLGDGSTVSRGLPPAVGGAPPLLSVAAGTDHTCALTTTSRALCWGGNQGGALGLGYNDTSAHPTPTPVVGDLVFASLDAGPHTTCGLTPAGQVFCWGGTDPGATPSLVARNVTFRSIGVVSTYFGPEYSDVPRGCGVATDSRGYCWGGTYAAFPIAGPVQP